MTENPEYPISETGHPARPPEDLQTNPEGLPQRGPAATAWRLLTEVNSTAGRLNYLGETHPEVHYFNKQAIDQIKETMAKLWPVDREVLQAVLPLDGSEAPNLNDPATIDGIAAQFGTDAKGLMCDIKISLGRFTELHNANFGSQN